MRKIIKNREIIEDKWITVRADDAVDENGFPEGDIIVPLSTWQTFKAQLKQHSGNLGLLLSPDEEPSSIADEIDQFSVIAISFPKFADGRGYTSARELRCELDYQGELRAVGDVLRDQLYIMDRCGFNSFAVREDRSIDEALTAFDDFSANYQGDTHEPRPLYRR